MNKISYALALGVSLALASAASAAPIVQQLDAPELSAATFSSLFKPIDDAPAITSNYQFMNTPVTGVVQSQVFEGTGAYAGLYAYAYQFGVNDVSDSAGQATSVNSASLQFNATPVRADLLGTGGAGSAVYVVKDGTVGSLNLPSAASGGIIATPSSVAWMPGDKTGALTFQYLDASKNTGPVDAGSTTGTIVVLTTEPWTNKPVSLQNANPQIAYPSAYSADGGDIQEVPVPEPATVLSWAGMIVAAGVMHHRRSRRAA
ncbi:hypothetical protein [Paludisphaera rhizosphaerae]|uniref:hypothetical protein n=1 Tax=Paludisphaera rhizosphaerae TaxID=2711216 RepID=UPI0013ED2AB7|nr:hypothetical protein [Paludisphaera rhizosphaerae]